MDFIIFQKKKIYIYKNVSGCNDMSHFEVVEKSVCGLASAIFSKHIWFYCKSVFDIFFFLRIRNSKHPRILTHETACYESVISMSGSVSTIFEIVEKCFCGYSHNQFFQIEFGFVPKSIFALFPVRRPGKS